MKQSERVPEEIEFLANLKFKRNVGKITGFNAVMSIRDILLNKTPKNNLEMITVQKN